MPAFLEPLRKLGAAKTHHPHRGAIDARAAPEREPTMPRCVAVRRAVATDTEPCRDAQRMGDIVREQRYLTAVTVSW